MSEKNKYNCFKSLTDGLKERSDDILIQENQSLKEQIKILMFMVKDHDKFNHNDFKHDLGTCDFLEYVEICKEEKQSSIDELRKQFEHNFNNMDLSKDINCNYMHHDTRLKWIGYYRCAVNNKYVKGVE